MSPSCRPAPPRSATLTLRPASCCAPCRPRRLVCLHRDSLRHRERPRPFGSHSIGARPRHPQIPPSHGWQLPTRNRAARGSTSVGAGLYKTGGGVRRCRSVGCRFRPCKGLNVWQPPDRQRRRVSFLPPAEKGPKKGRPVGNHTRCGTVYPDNKHKVSLRGSIETSRFGAGRLSGI